MCIDQYKVYPTRLSLQSTRGNTICCHDKVRELTYIRENFHSCILYDISITIYDENELIYFINT